MSKNKKNKGNKNFSCCFKCESRFIGCHNSCVSYKKEQEKNKKIKSLIFKGKKVNNEMASYKITKEINRRKNDKKCTKY